MAKLSVKAGSTSQTVDIFIQDSTAIDGSGKTGLVFNTSGLTAYFNFPASASTQITLATLSTPTASFSSGGFKEIDATNQKGHYRFDIPNACLVSGSGRSCKIVFQCTGCVPCPLEIELTGWDNQDATSGGISNISAIATTTTNTYNIVNSGTFGNSALLTAITAGSTISTNAYNIVNSVTFGNNALLTNINNINNLSALANLFGPTVLSRPTSGSIAYPITLTVKTIEGLAIDLDSNAVTLTALSAAGADLSANLSSVTHSATGEYKFTYTVHSTDTELGLAITASGAVSSSPRKAYLNTDVTDAATSVSLAAIQAKTDKLTFDVGNNVYSTLIAESTTIPDSYASTIPGRLNQLYHREFGHVIKDVTLTPHTIKMKDSAGSHTYTTQQILDDGQGNQTLNQIS